MLVGRLLEGAIREGEPLVIPLVDGVPWVARVLGADATPGDPSRRALTVWGTAPRPERVARAEAASVDPARLVELTGAMAAHDFARVVHCPDCARSVSSLAAPAAKRILRHGLREARSAVPPEESTRRSAAATEHLMAHPWIGSARTVLAYVSIRGELDTSALLERLSDRGIGVAVPDIRSGAIVPRLVTGGLVPGRYGIPTSDGPAVDVDVVIVPGLGFTREGVRLGFGGGFYDRFLAGRELRTIGMGYRFQVLPWLPSEAHDQRVDEVVTD